MFYIAPYDIKVENYNNKIVNLENVVNLVLHKMTKMEKVTLQIYCEGSCCESIGLYRILDILTDKFDYPKENITIQTMNILEKHKNYNVEIFDNPFVWLTKKNIDKKFQKKTFSSNFSHFGSFNARCNLYRLWIASELNYCYSEKSLLTFHLDFTNNYFNEMLTDSFLFLQEKDKNIINKCFSLFQKLPLKLKQLQTNQYPIKNTFSLQDVYPDFFVEVVAETALHGKTFFPTEKIWRPIALKTPFIVHASQNYIENLKKLGFQTFSKWWPETYNKFSTGNDDSLQKSIIEIQNILQQISNYSIKDLKNIYDEMQPVLDHNFTRLMELKPEDFKKLQ